MDEEIKDHERIAKQIAKTSNSICKKYRALKAIKWRKTLERHFKSIVELLKQIIENTVGEKSDVELGENETFFLGEEEPKRSNLSFDNSLISISFRLNQCKLKRSKTLPSNLSEASKILQEGKLSYEHLLPPLKKFSKSPMSYSCRPSNTRCKHPRDKKNCRHTMTH